MADDNQDQEDDEPEEPKIENQGSQTTRDPPKAEDKAGKAESSDDEIEPPRSCSLPIAKWVEPAMNEEVDDMLDAEDQGGW